MNTVTLCNGQQGHTFRTRDIFYCRWNGHETSCLVSEACAASKMNRLITEMKNPDSSPGLLKDLQRKG